MFSVLKSRAIPFCAIAICTMLPQFAAAGSTGLPTSCQHITNGVFDVGEWDCASVSKSVFASAGGGGGASLYVDQGIGNDNTLYLMYDYTASGIVSPAAFALSFFDVFFEVVPDGHAYLVHIDGSGINGAFERPIGSIAPLNPDGTFLIPGDWDPLDAGDLALAKFLGAIGNGPSPDLGAPHLMAEFQLTISRPGSPAGGGHGDGIYDPAPAFWGASEKTGGAGDPPISSGIFTLNPDGSSIVTPILGPNGAPLQQGTVTPEPASLLLLGAGALALLGFKRKR